MSIRERSNGVTVFKRALHRLSRVNEAADAVIPYKGRSRMRKFSIIWPGISEWRLVRHLASVASHARSREIA